MSLKICSLASGSTGNCIFVASETTKILIDVGIPITRIEKCLKKLDVTPDNFSLLITHCHHDHIKDVPSYCKKFNSPVYCHYLTTPKVKCAKSKVVEFDEGDFFIGDITVSPFRVSHDVPCVGYSLYHKGKKISIATDLGFVGKEVLINLSDSDLVLLECNHDIDMLNNGRYAPWLKKRILSDKGHLSNKACAEASLVLARGGVRQLILGHLSRDNNYPELAYNTVSTYLRQNGVVEGKDMGIEVAGFDRMSCLYNIS